MKLELFKRDTCPYCARVMHVIEKSGRTDIEYRDITTSEADRARLVEVGGKQQVPCLFIDGKPLYESSDIIAWLQAHPQ
ncbi:MAG: glutaredoxin family protein [Coriobacteriales bacterium]|jgi:glutaredoxin 3